MEAEQMRELLMKHQDAIVRLDGKASDTDRRIGELETTRELLIEIKISLKELSMSNVNGNEKNAEKYGELKASIDQMTKENQKQHEELTVRLTNLESKPGKRYETLWVVVLTAIIGIAAGFFGSVILPVVK